MQYAEHTLFSRISPTNSVKNRGFRMTLLLLMGLLWALVFSASILGTGAFLFATANRLDTGRASLSMLVIGKEGYSRPLKVSIIGSGNWGTAVARRIGQNIQDLISNGDESFADDLLMWVYEEDVDGRKISEIINTEKENTKYLPGVQLPTNLRACPDIIESCQDADILLFIAPHQFLKSILEQIKVVVRHDVIAVSLIKGLEVGASGPILLSDMIKNTLELSTDVAVLMGANLASEVARDSPVEATIACRDLEIANLLAKLFESKPFRVDISKDVLTVEVCGALKNVVAMGAGFCDALETSGSSSKAAILRRGIYEMVAVSRAFSGDDFDADAVISCSGTIADVIASSYGGRNYKCAKEFAKRVLAMEKYSLSSSPSSTTVAAGDPQKENGEQQQQQQQLKERNSLWSDIEKELLKGQKLQGLGTCDELIACLENAKLLDTTTIIGGKESDTFGLFKKIYAISRLGESPSTIMEY